MPDEAPIHVLVIDDESVIVDELLEFLGYEGITTSSAGDAAAALLVLGQAPPGAVTVILTDVKMPGQDGLSIASSILRDMSEAFAVEVIIMSGHGDFNMAVDALRARVFDFIRKPLRLTELLDMVQRAHAAALARRRTHRETTEGIARLREEARSLAERAAMMATRVESRDEQAGSAFLHIISDELRNPLVPVLGLAEVIERNAAALPPAQLAEYAGLIRKAGERLTMLIDTMLTLVSLEAGRGPGVPRPERTSGILAELARRHDEEARARGQTIETHAAAADCVMTDRRYLLMALDQIVTNALRYGPAGQTVHIDAEQVGDSMVFRVTDRGPGMTSAQLQDLRKPFRRGDMSLTRRSGGLGIGLTLADRAAQALCGRLEIDSVPGEGTAAAIVLPGIAGQP